MGIYVSCTCGKRYSVESRFAGKKVRCKACGAAMTIGADPHPPGGSSSPPTLNDLADVAASFGGSNGAANPVAVAAVAARMPPARAVARPAARNEGAGISSFDASRIFKVLPLELWVAVVAIIVAVVTFVCSYTPSSGVLVLTGAHSAYFYTNCGLALLGLGYMVAANIMVSYQAKCDGMGFFARRIPLVIFIYAIANCRRLGRWLLCAVYGVLMFIVVLALGVWPAISREKRYPTIDPGREATSSARAEHLSPGSTSNSGVHVDLETPHVAGSNPDGRNATSSTPPKMRVRISPGQDVQLGNYAIHAAGGWNKQSVIGNTVTWSRFASANKANGAAFKFIFAVAPRDQTRSKPLIIVNSDGGSQLGDAILPDAILSTVTLNGLEFTRATHDGRCICVAYDGPFSVRIEYQLGRGFNQSDQDRAEAVLQSFHRVSE